MSTEGMPLAKWMVAKEAERCSAEEALTKMERFLAVLISFEECSKGPRALKNAKHYNI